ncbi:MAG: orotidine-5'-phosphate decarboxylase [Candidatus Anstonellales archaeon]
MQKTLSRLEEDGKTSLLCFGIDPVIEKIPIEGTIEDRIENFFYPIIDKLKEENLIRTIKPNYAFFAQYGFEGLFALEHLIERYKDELFIILDAKRGDIGKTSEAYAKEVFEFWQAHAVTVSPYMGFDSVQPFLQKGFVYLLARTSNKGAEDFQMLELKTGGRVYEKVVEKAMEWKTGIVVGATSEDILKVCEKTKAKVPMLIPGIGAQGGDLETVIKAIKPNPSIHRINVSSSLAYAYEKKQTKDFVRASFEEAKELDLKIKKLSR